MKALTMILVCIGLVFTLMVTSGCADDKGSSEVREEAVTAGDALSEGVFVDVHLKILDDGALYATSIEVDSDEGDEHEGDADDDEDELEAKIISIAADQGSFVVLGNLTVVLQPEDDEEGDVDDEEEDIDDDLAIDDLEVGAWVELEGAYSESDGVFYAEEVELHDDFEYSIESVITDLDDAGFAMLGLAISYDENTVIQVDIEETDDDSDNGDDEDEDDLDDDNGDDDDNDDDDEDDDE